MEEATAEAAAMTDAREAEHSEEEERLGRALLEAGKGGRLPEVEALLEQGAPAYYQEEEGGTSVLMHAAGGVCVCVCVGGCVCVCVWVGVVMLCVHVRGAGRCGGGDESKALLTIDPWE
jgi:ferric-dicitrate binding protein FerR (iron transport regulator)